MVTTRPPRCHRTSGLPPDGTVFYVADMKGGGVVLVDPIAFSRVGFIKTGIGAHGLYPSRDGTRLYVTNRGWNTTAGGRHGPGSISVLDFSTRRIVETWPVPGGGSPDMGNVTADGSELWVSGRYDDEVYVFATATGTLTHRIPVGREPHGLCVWPQPGRYSLGHTGNMLSQNSYIVGVLSRIARFWIGIGALAGHRPWNHAVGLVRKADDDSELEN